jgi:CubicO group peptidase (beta-lactamase class C family)
MKKDQVVAKYAYGWKDKAFTMPLQENAVLRLASNDKVITRAAVRAILDGNTVDPVTGIRVTADTKVFPLPRAHGLTPIPNATVPANIDLITIQQLIDHTSGIRELPDQNTLYTDLGITPGTSNATDNVRWVYSKDTNSTPGSQTVYSSSGYMVLRYLVQTLKGDLLTYLRSTIFSPVGSGDIFLAYERLENRQPTEPWYATLEAPSDRWIFLENYTALNASSESLVRFLRRYHIGFGNPLVDPATGGYLATPDNGWGPYAGGMAGTTSYTIQRRWDEVGIAVIFNIGGNYDDLVTQLYDQIDRTAESDWGL